jgi:hypothetical protein
MYIHVFGELPDELEAWVERTDWIKGATNDPETLHDASQGPGAESGGNRGGFSQRGEDVGYIN